MIRRSLSAVLLVVIAGLLLIVAWPQLFRLEWAPLVVQAVSLRGLGVATAAAITLALVVAALFSVPLRRFIGSVIVLLLAFCAVNLAVLSVRGFGGTDVADAPDGAITVLSWNTLGDAPGAETIATLALESDADVVTLPETTEATAIAVAELMREGGKPMWEYTTAFDQISKARSTSLLISADLGTYTVQEDRGNTAVLPTVIATADNGTGPTIVAVHAVSPIVGEMDNWRSDLTWLAATCTGDNVIMAGDFNSTLDHFGRLAGSPTTQFGDCRDSALEASGAAVGTWPASLPSVLGSQIDHVMATDEWTVSGMRVVQSLDEAGSDHRPVVVQLVPTK